MPNFNLTIPHKLPKEEATKRIKKLLTKVKKEYGSKISNLEEEWSENRGAFSFKATGFAVSGTLIVRTKDVVLDGTLPFAASFFKSKIKKIITDEAKTVLM